MSMPGKWHSRSNKYAGGWYPRGAVWTCVLDRHDPVNTFCVYCQRQFRNIANFKRHVIGKHGVGLAKSLGLVQPDDWTPSADEADYGRGQAPADAWEVNIPPLEFVHTNQRL